MKKDLRSSAQDKMMTENACTERLENCLDIIESALKENAYLYDIEEFITQITRVIKTLKEDTK